eukprot:2358029-Lingulodinium_polyedra.AAC.1
MIRLAEQGRDALGLVDGRHASATAPRRGVRADDLRREAHAQVEEEVRQDADEPEHLVRRRRGPALPTAGSCGEEEEALEPGPGPTPELAGEACPPQPGEQWPVADDP